MEIGFGTSYARIGSKPRVIIIFYGGEREKFDGGVLVD